MELANGLRVEWDGGRANIELWCSSREFAFGKKRKCASCTSGGFLGGDVMW